LDSLDPLCLLEDGMFGSISDIAKKPRYSTTNGCSTLLGNADHGISHPLSRAPTHDSGQIWLP
jgi:hypothetical protein